MDELGADEVARLALDERARNKNKVSPGLVAA